MGIFIKVLLSVLPDMAAMLMDSLKGKRLIQVKPEHATRASNVLPCDSRVRALADDIYLVDPDHLDLLDREAVPYEILLEDVNKSIRDYADSLDVQLHPGEPKVPEEGPEAKVTPGILKSFEEARKHPNAGVLDVFSLDPGKLTREEFTSTEDHLARCQQCSRQVKSLKSRADFYSRQKTTHGDCG